MYSLKKKYSPRPGIPVYGLSSQKKSKQVQVEMDFHTTGICPGNILYPPTVVMKKLSSYLFTTFGVKSMNTYLSYILTESPCNVREPSRGD